MLTRFTVRVVVPTTATQHNNPSSHGRRGLLITLTGLFTYQGRKTPFVVRHADPSTCTLGDLAAPRSFRTEEQSRGSALAP